MATTTATTTETRTEKGISLARGPALILGTILLVAGLYLLYKQHTFLKFSNFPNGSAPVPGKVFLGIFGANGWTGMLTAAGGGLLLFGAAQHLLAKTMSLIVGIALGAAAIIAAISGNVLGMAAANRWTEIGWGVVAAILLFNTLIPRRRTAVADGYDDGVGRRGLRRRRRHEGEAVAAGAGAGAIAEHEHDKHRAREGEPANSNGEYAGTRAARSDDAVGTGSDRAADGREVESTER
jgi:lysylphosphatidylglycerol synthetase-like protein (DUF2156 family)